jgi:hypothetical protein
MRTNTVEPDRPQMAIGRTRFACWITKATDKLRIRNVYCLSAATVVTRTRIARLVTAHSKISALSNVMICQSILYIPKLLFILRPGAMFVRNFLGRLLISSALEVAVAY